MVDGVLDRARGPFGNGLVYVFRCREEGVIDVVLSQGASGIGAVALQETVFFEGTALLGRKGGKITLVGSIQTPMCTKIA